MSTPPRVLFGPTQNTEPGSIQVQGSLPAGTHKERLARALHSRNKNALDYLPNRQKCSHLTSKGQSHFCPSLPTQGVEDLIWHGWRSSSHFAYPTHLLLWWEDLDNIQYSEQFSNLKKKKKGKKREKNMRKIHDETARVLLCTQNVLVSAFWRAFIQKSVQYPKRQQSENSRYLVSISQTDKWHLSLTKHKHVPQPRGKMFLKPSTSIHWKNYTTSFPQKAQHFQTYLKNVLGKKYSWRTAA